jgi:hypothetical protein
VVLSAAGRGFSLRGRRGHQDLKWDPPRRQPVHTPRTADTRPPPLGLQISNQGADAAFATLSPHLTGAVRDTTIVEHAEIPIHRPGGLVDTTPSRPSLRHLRQNHHRLTDTGPWARTARLRNPTRRPWLKARQWSGELGCLPR